MNVGQFFTKQCPAKGLYLMTTSQSQLHLRLLDFRATMLADWEVPIILACCRLDCGFNPQAATGFLFFSICDCFLDFPPRLQAITKHLPFTLSDKSDLELVPISKHFHRCSEFLQRILHFMQALGLENLTLHKFIYKKFLFDTSCLVLGGTKGQR